MAQSHPIPLAPRVWVAVCLTLATAFAHAALYRTIDLGFDAVEIDNWGQVIGNTDAGAVIWDPVFGTRSVGPGVAVDINNAGAVLGYDADGTWLWTSLFGRVYLDELTNPKAMNDRFEIAGWQDLDAPDTGYVWSLLNGFTHTQDKDSQVFSPRDLNNRGDVVGTKSLGESQYAIWEHGSATSSLLTPAMVFGASIAINDGGTIAAAGMLGPTNGVDSRCYPGIGCPHAVVWNDLVPAWIAEFAGAMDINNGGSVVGFKYVDGYGRDQSMDAFAFIRSEESGLVNLNDLIAPGDPFFGADFFSSANEINDWGWILASESVFSGFPSPARYLLIPGSPHGVPEPPTAALVLLAVGALGFVTRRRKH